MIEIYFNGTLLPDENYISFDYSYKQFEDEFFLGSVASVQAKLQIPKTALPSTLTNVLVKIDHADYLYLVVNEIKDEDDAICTLSLSDKLSNTDVSYDIQSVVPITAKNLLIKICTDFNIPHDTFNFTGQDKIIASYDNTLTARNYIEQIAENAFGYAIINKYGKLEIKTYKQEPTVHNRITAGDLDTYKLGDKITIERVVYEFGAIKYDTSDTHDTSLYTLVMNSNNMFLQTLTEAEFKVAANNILGFSFYNIKIDTTNILYRDSEILYFVDTNNVEYRILNQRESSYAGGFISTYETEINNTKQEFTKIINPSEKIKRLKQIVDQEANTITIIANSVDSISKPLNTIEGDNLHFEDGLNTEIVDLTIEGKSEQETRSGKNLFRTYSASVTSAGINWKYNPDGTIVGNGTATATSYSMGTGYALSSGNNVTLEPGTYTLSGGISNRLRLVLAKTVDNTIIATDTGNGNTFTLTAATNVYITTAVNTNEVLSNLAFYPMISKDAGEYEPYGKMPSPEFPSEIRSVGYTNLWNHGDIENIGWATQNIELRDFLNTLDIGKYTFTLNFVCNEILKTSTNNVYGIAFYNSFARIVSQTSTTELKPNETYTHIFTIEITNDNKGKFTIAYLYGFGNGTDGKTGSSTLINIQIEKGIIAHPYIQFGKYGIEYVNTGDNLFNTKNLVPIPSGMNINIIDNNSVEVSNQTSLSYRYVRFIIRGLKKNTNYSFKGNYINSNSAITTLWFGVADEDGTTTLINTSYSSGQIKTFNTGNFNNVGIRLYSTGSIAGINTAAWSNIQLQEGTTLSNFEQYKEDTHLFILDEPLRSADDIKDIAIIKNNKLEVIRNIRNLRLKISDMNNSESYPGWRDLPNLHDDYPGINASLRSQAKYLSNITDWNTSGISINTTGDTGATLFLTISILGLTQSQWKSMHPNLEFEVNYSLKTPTYETYDEVPTPILFKGINNIIINDELKPNLRLTYVRDTSINSYVEGQIQSEKIIRTERISELQLSDEQILARVGTLEEDYSGIEGRISTNEATLEKINKSFDDDGNVIAVRVQQGMKFDSEGLDFYTSDNSLNTLIRNDGVYFKDGNDTVAECKKDGFMAIDLKQKGQHFYSWNGTGYDFVDERIEVDGDNCYATFYEGGD